MFMCVIFLMAKQENVIRNSVTANAKTKTNTNISYTVDHSLYPYCDF